MDEADLFPAASQSSRRTWNMFRFSYDHTVYLVYEACSDFEAEIDLAKIHHTVHSGSCWTQNLKDHSDRHQYIITESTPIY